MTFKTQLVLNHLHETAKSKYCHAPETWFWNYRNGFHVKKTLRFDLIVF